MFTVNKPVYGWLPTQTILDNLSDDHLRYLRIHALTFACMDYNKNDTNYLHLAYANLWNAGSLGDLPCLYPTTSADAHWATRPENITDTKAQNIRSHFEDVVVGNENNLTIIYEKAFLVLGSKEAAHDWIDHYSNTLGQTPRVLSLSKEGTEKVLLHLSGISRHSHDA